MKRLLIFITALFLLVSLNGQILRYSNYVAPAEGYTEQYEAILTAMTNDPTGDTLTWQNDLVYSLDSAGYWDRIQLLYMPVASSSLADSYINWANPGTYDLTDPGATTPVLDRVAGWDADNSDYLSTGWNPRSDSTIVGKNNVSLGVWLLDEIAADYSFGSYDGSRGLSIYPVGGSGNFAARLNESTALDLGVQSSSIGFSLATRRGTIDTEGYYNGISNGTSELASSASVTNAALYILAYNNNGTAAGFATGIVSIVIVIQGLSDDEQLVLYNIFHRYMTRIGL